MICQDNQTKSSVASISQLSYHCILYQTLNLHVWPHGSMSTNDFKHQDVIMEILDIQHTIIHPSAIGYNDIIVYGDVVVAYSSSYVLSKLLPW